MPFCYDLAIYSIYRWFFHCILQLNGCFLSNLFAISTEHGKSTRINVLYISYIILKTSISTLAIVQCTTLYTMQTVFISYLIQDDTVSIYVNIHLWNHFSFISLDFLPATAYQLKISFGITIKLFKLIYTDTNTTNFKLRYTVLHGICIRKKYRYDSFVISISHLNYLVIDEINVYHFVQMQMHVY